LTYIYQAVERIPDPMIEGVVYHTHKFKLAALLCACGCRHRVMLLVPDSHQVTSQSGLATIRPSIAVCDGPCKSHYFVTDGQVEWLPAFSAAQATSLMQNQIARHVAHDRKPQSLFEAAWSVVLLAVSRIRKFFR
jgi:hypothetical protein